MSKDIVPSDPGMAELVKAAGLTGRVCWCGQPYWSRETGPGSELCPPCKNHPASDRSGFKPWEDSTCGGCRLAVRMRRGELGLKASPGAGCADHEEPEA